MSESVTIRNGEATVESMDVERADFNSAYDGTATGILGTARHRENGSVVVGQVGPDDIVRLPGGMVVEASFAADHGFLVRNPDGSFSDVPGTPHSHAPASAAGRSDAASPHDAPDDAPESDLELTPAASNADPNAADDQPAEPLAVELEEMIADADAVARPTCQAIMESALDTGGDVPTGTLQLLATAMNVPVQDVASKYHAITDGLRQQVADLATASGFNADEFIDWANHPDRAEKFRDAVRQHVGNGSLRGWRAMIRDAAAEIVEHDPASAARAKTMDGLTITPGDDGRPMVRLKTGHVVLLAEAIRAGAVVIRHTGKGSARSGRKA